ncbi:MAG: transcription antitermination factor NusB [Candidatus Aminicenantaceae bacterium]
MGQRRKARELTLQILFQLEFYDSDLKQEKKKYWKQRKCSKGIRDYSDWLVDGVLSNKDKVDEIIGAASIHWRIPRMNIVDRNILRMAVYELLYEKNVPQAVVINEAIEIAKKYSTDNAATFINGILDRIRKDLEKKKIKDQNNV